MAFAGCSSPLLRDYRYSGVGDFKEVSLTIPGKVIPGFEITLPEFDLSSAQMAEYRLGRLPTIPGAATSISLAVECRDAAEMKELSSRSIRRDAGLPFAPSPWAGSLQVSLSDVNGRTIWKTTDRIEEMSSLPGHARRGWLGSTQRVWDIPREPNTEVILRFEYRPDASRPQLARKAYFYLRAGGSK